MVQVVRYISIMLLLILYSTGTLCVSQASSSTGKKITAVYQLYSWQEADKSWNFSILPDTDRQKTVDEVFDAKKLLRGTDELRLRLHKLPKGTRVVWFDRLTIGGVKVKRSEKLKYPPAELVAQIKKDAMASNIEVVGP